MFPAKYEISSLGYLYAIYDKYVKSVYFFTNSKNDRLKDHFEKFHIYNSEVERLHILVSGPVEAKTSFISSIDHVLQQWNMDRVAIDKTSDHSFTERVSHCPAMDLLQLQHHLVI